MNLQYIHIHCSVENKKEATECELYIKSKLYGDWYKYRRYKEHGTYGDYVCLYGDKIYENE